MFNFNFHTPTRILFGRGEIQGLGKAVRECGDKALLVYGGNSIRKTGLYDKITGLLGESGVTLEEISGVQPNPRIDSVRKGAALCRERGIEVVVAVGGGSVIDCAKVIAAAAAYQGDPLDLVKDPSKIGAVLPIFSVVTIAATGSEMDGFAVISNPETQEKLTTGNEGFKPRLSILDPEYTFTVSKRQTAAGTADIMSHVLESYFNNIPGAFIQARLAEALLKTCVKYGEIAIKEPENYEARSNLMWAASLAINGLVSSGAPVAWAVHAMEHELSAFHDMTHGEGLAILIPRWMEFCLNEKTRGRFVEYGINVWGLDPGLGEEELARQSIEKTRDYFFKALELPSSLGEAGIGAENFEAMAKRAAGPGMGFGFVPLDYEGILAIYRASL